MHSPKSLSSLFVTALVFAIAPHAAVTAQGRTAVLKVPGDHPTISAAIAAANPGDTVRVAGGTYREQVVIDKAIKLHGAGREKTIIDGENRTDLTSLGQVRVVAAGDVTSLDSPSPALAAQVQLGTTRRSTPSPRSPGSPTTSTTTG